MRRILLFAAMGTAAAMAGQREEAHNNFISGRFSEAATQYRALLGQYEGEHTLRRAIAMENLGVSLRAMREWEEARPLMEQAALEISELAGEDSQEALLARVNLAALYWSAGDLPKAARLTRELLDKVPDDRMATFYGNLSAAAIAEGDYQQAEDLARRGLEIGKRALAEDDSRRAVLFNNLAQACRFNGHYLEAEAHYREALGLWERSVGASDPDYARGLLNFAAFYHERGRESGAESLYLRAAELLAGHDRVLELVARNELADVLRAQLRYTEARKLARSTLAAMEGALRADDVRLVRARCNWQLLESEMKRITIAKR